MLSTIETRGGALRIRCSSAELADHSWQQRERLLQLTGAQRFLLTIEMDGADPIHLSWEPPQLPANLTTPTRRPRRR